MGNLSLSEDMRRSWAKTRWGIRGVSLVFCCAVVNSAATGDERRAGRDWWSLQPLRPVAAPRADESPWPLNPIDHFILDRLQKEGLVPSAAADRRTLLRRL